MTVLLEECLQEVFYPWRYEFLVKLPGDVVAVTEFYSMG